MTIQLEACLSSLFLRLGRWELYARREAAPHVRYGLSREGGQTCLDLPGLSAAFGRAGA